MRSHEDGERSKGFFPPVVLSSIKINHALSWVLGIGWCLFMLVFLSKQGLKINVSN